MSGSLAKTYNASIERIGGSVGKVARKRIDRKRLYFPYLSEALSRVPFAFGWKIRRAIHARILLAFGEDIVLQHGVLIEDERTSFGNDIWVSVGTYIDYAIIED